MLVTRKLSALLGFALLLSWPLLSQEPAEREFASGYAGSLPADPTFRARTYFNTPSVRRLIFEMENGPTTRVRVDEALRDTGFYLDQLLRLKILRQHKDQFFIAFNYFTRDDMVAIYRVAEERVPSLVDAYLERQDEFEAIFDTYPVKSVLRDRIALVLIAGISLNWDGLNLTLEQGFRKPNLVEGEHWRYSFWAAEQVPGRSTRGFIWGSSTFPLNEFNFPNEPVDFAFSSFGDPHSEPRMNLPDLLGISREAMAPGVREASERIGLLSEQFLGREYEGVLGFELGRDIGSLLFGLRGGAKPAGELVTYVREPEKLPALLALLAENPICRPRRKWLLFLIGPGARLCRQENGG